MLDQKETVRAAAELKKELKFPFKTPADCMMEALKRLSKDRKPTEKSRTIYVMKGKTAVPVQVEVAKLTVQEILDMDNAARKEAPKCFGLRPLKKYPIILDEYSPATQKATWKKLIGGEIIMEPGKLAVAVPLFEECDGFDPAQNLEILESEVNKECARLYPTEEPTKEDKKAIRNSLIQRKNLELADAELVEPEEKLKKGQLSKE